MSRIYILYAGYLLFLASMASALAAVGEWWELLYLVGLAATATLWCYEARRRVEAEGRYALLADRVARIGRGTR